MITAEPWLLTVLLFGSLSLCLVLGLPLAFTMGGIAVVFTLVFWDPAALYLVAARIFGGMTIYVMVAVPLFIFMANMLERSGVAADIYSAIHLWMGWVRGGLAV